MCMGCVGLVKDLEHFLGFDDDGKVPACRKKPVGVEVERRLLEGSNDLLLGGVSWHPGARCAGTKHARRDGEHVRPLLLERAEEVNQTASRGRPPLGTCLHRRLQPRLALLFCELGGLHVGRQVAAREVLAGR
eukprot:scaffold125902_cov30-Tisochrysis_lutea.AAC.2